MGTEADLIKQSCWAKAEAAKAGKHKALHYYQRSTVTACTVSVKTKILATLRKAGEYIYSREILLRIAKFGKAVDKTRNMEHPETFRNIPEHEKKKKMK